MQLPALRNADTQTRLATYLNDHRAGAAGGLELARRLCGNNQGNEYGPPLERIAREVEEDIEALEDVMTRFGVESDQVKRAAAWSMEKVGRLKLNGQLLGHSPLSRLVELEGMMMGVSGKLAMWIVLNDLYADDPRLDGIDLANLIDRAREQRQTLESLRRRAAREGIT
jgi:hypothetical protein